MMDSENSAQAHVSFSKTDFSSNYHLMYNEGTNLRILIGLSIEVQR